jgi:hypothetical protein
MERQPYGDNQECSDFMVLRARMREKSRPSHAINYDESKWHPVKAGNIVGEINSELGHNNSDLSCRANDAGRLARAYYRSSSDAV